MKKTEKEYTVIIVSGSTSTNKEFVISSRLIRKSIIAFSALLLIFGFIIFDYLFLSFSHEHLKRKKNVNGDKIKKQDVLEKVNNAMSVLHKYISSQKDELAKNKKNLEEMHDEIDEVKPLHKESKELFDSYFKLYSKFYEKKYNERLWIGILLGILPSLIAGIILLIIPNLLKRRKKSANQPKIQ